MLGGAAWLMHAHCLARLLCTPLTQLPLVLLFLLQVAPTKVGDVFSSYQTTTGVVGLTFQNIQMPSGGTFSLREWRAGTGCLVQGSTAAVVASCGS